MAPTLDRRRVGAGLALLSVPFAALSGSVHHGTYTAQSVTYDIRNLRGIFVVGSVLLLSIGFWQLFGKSDTVAKGIALATGFSLAASAVVEFMDLPSSGFRIQSGFWFGTIAAILTVASGFVLPRGAATVPNPEAPTNARVDRRHQVGVGLFTASSTALLACFFLPWGTYKFGTSRGLVTVYGVHLFRLPFESQASTSSTFGFGEIVGFYLTLVFAGACAGVVLFAIAGRVLTRYHSSRISWTLRGWIVVLSAHAIFGLWLPMLASVSDVGSQNLPSRVAYVEDARWQRVTPVAWMYVVGIMGTLIAAFLMRSQPRLRPAPLRARATPDAQVPTDLAVSAT